MRRCRTHIHTSRCIGYLFPRCSYYAKLNIQSRMEYSELKHYPEQLFKKNNPIRSTEVTVGDSLAPPALSESLGVHLGPKYSVSWQKSSKNRFNRKIAIVRPQSALHHPNCLFETTALTIQPTSELRPPCRWYTQGNLGFPPNYELFSCTQLSIQYSPKNIKNATKMPISAIQLVEFYRFIPILSKSETKNFFLGSCLSSGGNPYVVRQVLLASS